MEEKTSNITQETKTNKEEIKLLGILCKRSNHEGTEQAGASEFNYSPSISVIQVVCSGRVAPAFILKNFKNNTDGILVGGCHLGDCHYQDGNYNAVQKIEYTKRILEYIGIDKRRLKLVWVSAAEGKRFSNLVNEFNSEIEEIGRLKLTEENLGKLDSLIEVLSDFKFKLLMRKKLTITEKGNVYSDLIPDEEYTRILDDIVKSELLRKRILTIIDGEAQSANEIAKRLKIESEIVMSNLIALMNNHMVTMEIKHHNAYFVKEEV